MALISDGLVDVQSGIDVAAGEKRHLWPEGGLQQGKGLGSTLEAGEGTS